MDEPTDDKIEQVVSELQLRGCDCSADDACRWILERDAAVARAEQAEADAAAVLNKVRSAYHVVHNSPELNLISYSDDDAQALNIAAVDVDERLEDILLNTTAGRDLLAELQRLREIVRRVDAACVSALPSHPEGPDNVEQAGAMSMAVDVLNIIRDQQPSEVSK